MSTRDPSQSRRPRNPESGAAFILVVTLLAALLAGGAVVVLLTSTQTRAAGESRRALDATYCAEAGLMQTREILGAIPDEWDTLLGGASSSPTIPVYPITGDLDGDGEDDYRVTIRDNDDDDPLDGTIDNDQRVFIVSTCIKYDEVSREVIELISTNSTQGDTYDQAGQGADGSGNIN